MTKPRSCPRAPAKTAAMWSRCCSDVIARAGQLAYPSTNGFRFVASKRGNLGRARGRVEADRGELEHALQRSARGIDVLDAPDWHERSPDRPQASLQVDVVVADLVAPAAPAERWDQRRSGRAEDDGDDCGQPSREACGSGHPLERECDHDGDGGAKAELYAPVRDCFGREALLRLAERLPGGPSGGGGFGPGAGTRPPPG